MSAVECPHGDDPAVCPPCRRNAGKDGQMCARLSTGANVHQGCAS